MKKLILVLFSASLLFPSCLKRDNEADINNGACAFQYRSYSLTEEQQRDGIVTPGELFYIKLRFDVASGYYDVGTIILESNSTFLQFVSPTNGNIDKYGDSYFQSNANPGHLALKISPNAPTGDPIIILMNISDANGNTDKDSLQFVVGQPW